MYMHTVYMYTVYMHTVYMHTVYVHLVHSLSLQELCFGSSLHARSRRGVHSEWTAQGQVVNVSVLASCKSLLCASSLAPTVCTHMLVCVHACMCTCAHVYDSYSQSFQLFCIYRTCVFHSLSRTLVIPLTN